MAWLVVALIVCMVALAICIWLIVKLCKYADRQRLEIAILQEIAIFDSANETRGQIYL